MICWDTTKSEDKLIGVSKVDLEENWDTTKSVGVSEVNLEENWDIFVILLEDAIEAIDGEVSNLKLEENLYNVGIFLL